MPSEVIFGTRLRAERETRGVSLDTIAQHTKVSRSLLADMERGCFDRWPPGIFGRAFIKGYAEAVGLDAEAVVSEFLDIFPDARTSSAADPFPLAPGRRTRMLPSPAEPRRPSVRPSSSTGLRLVLVDEPGDVTAVRRWPRASWLGSAIDAAFVVVPAAVTALLTTGMAPWMAAGLAGLGALVVVTTRLAGSPGLWLLQRRRTSVEEVAFEEPIEDVFITPPPRVDDPPEDLEVSPAFYRPPNVGRYGHRARHA